jgi:predicted transposase YdaD
MEADDVDVVEARGIPPIPDALRTAEIDHVARQLFYADYLVALEDGRYAMQAMQLVASLAPQTPETRAWLAYWGAGQP